MPGPGTWQPGDVLTAADLNAIGTFTDYTPTVTQSGTRTATVNYAKYGVVNSFMYVVVDLTMTQTGAGSNAISVSLPFSTSGGGSGFIFDSSANDMILCRTTGSGSSAVFVVEGGTSATDTFGLNPNFTLGLNDVISFVYFGTKA